MDITQDIEECINCIQTAIKTNGTANIKSKYNFKYLVVLDFEATCSNDKKLFKPIEIIEWPAIIIDIDKMKIYNDPKDYFHVYIKPTANPILTKFCTELTGITQEMVDPPNGIYIEQALDLWNKWCYNNDLLPTKQDPSPRACVVTCGDWDLRTMWAKQCKVSSFSFGNPAMLFAAWINVKQIFQEMMGLQGKVGMKGMLEILNMSLDGRHHSGIDDVKNICKIVLELLKRNKNIFMDYTQHFNSSKDNGISRSLLDDLCYANKMDKLLGNKRRNIRNIHNDDMKSDEKQQYEFIPRPKVLPTANVNVPWMNENIDMNVVQFHSSKKDVFGAQFSCLYYSDIVIDTSTKIYVKSKNLTTTLMVNVDEIQPVKFQSAEHIYQCSKALNKWDDLFMRTLTAFDCGKAGAGRLHIRSGKMKKLYESFGGSLIQKGSGKGKRWWFSENGYIPLRENWDEIKIQIMYHSLKQKFLQNTELIEEYLTGNLPVYFIEHVEYEGDSLWADGGGNGKNWLGKLLTIVAWMMRYNQNDKNCVVDLLDDKFLKWMNTPNKQMCAFKVSTPNKYS